MESLDKYLKDYESKFPEQAGISLAIKDIAESCKRISDLVSRCGLVGMQGDAGEINVQGESQQKMDIFSNQVMLDVLSWSGNWAGLASEEMEGIYPIPISSERGKFLCLFDPLDGSGNIDIDMPIGTIFSILPYNKETPPLEEDFLLSGRNQIGAGYVLYGAATIMVLTLGEGVIQLTLDRSRNEFIITDLNLTIPKGKNKFMINMSNQRFWHDDIKKYIDNCLKGEDGEYKTNYNMRWTGCMVADVHRVLVQGGVFMYPEDKKDKNKPTKLRLMYEASPMAFIIEQAGGDSTNGKYSLLDIQPKGLHERVSVICGDKEEINKIKSLTK